MPVRGSAFADIKHKTWVTDMAEAPTSDAPEMTVSTWAVDRENDRVLPEGGDFTNFKRNPILLWCHDYSTPPIGRVEQLSVRPGHSVSARWRWVSGDPLADRVKNCWEQSAVSGSSIGFKPIETTPNSFGGRDILRWELLEISLCPIPANPTATRSAAHMQRVEKEYGVLKRFDLAGANVTSASDWGRKAAAREVSLARSGATGHMLNQLDGWAIVRAASRAVDVRGSNRFDRVFTHPLFPDDLRFVHPRAHPVVMELARSKDLI